MQTPAPIFEWAEWTFEPAEWRLIYAGTAPVSLPNKTLELLVLLLDRAPGLVSKDEILGTVWSDAVVEEGNIAFHVALLRRTLDIGGAERSCIETVRGKGYRFVASVGRRDAALVEEPPAAPVLEPAASSDSLSAPDSGPVAEDAPAVAAEPIVDVIPQAGAARRRLSPGWALLVITAFAAAASLFFWRSGSTNAAVRDVAVLPVASGPEAGAPAGVADAIVARLSAMTTLRARTVTPANASEPPVETARRAGAETILLTAVDASRDPWRVDVQIIRARDGQRIWSWAFDVRAGTSDVRSAIAANIATGVGRHFRVALEKPAGRTPNAEALTLTLRAREAWRLRTPPSVQHAIALYERAITMDPSFAPAYAGLADCYNLTMSGLPVDVRAANATKNAERALALDPGLADAHTSRAFSLYKFEWKWSEAEAAFRRAIAADPGYALAHHWYGEMLGYLGRFDESIAELRQAHALDPDSVAIITDLVGPLLHSGRLAEARALLEKGAAINPTFHSIPRRRGEILAAEGRERESLEETWRAAVLTGVSLESVEELRASYRAGGLPAVLRVEIARLEAGGTEPFGVPAQATILASRYARLGDREKALHWISVAIDRHEDIALHLPTYPDYDTLRDDPEFQRQLARTGIPPVRSR